MKTITEDVVKQIHKNLVATYGSALTLEYVKAQVEAIQRGETPRNVIGTLAQSMLRQNGYLKDGAA